MSRLKQIFLIFLAYYGITCLSNIYFIFGPFYEKMGASPQTIGFFLSIFYLMNCVCRPVGSAFMEKLNIRRTLIIGGVICLIASFGIEASLDNTSMLFLFRAIMGLGVSVFSVAAVAAQSILLDEKSRGFGFALFTTGSMLPLATIVPLCEWFLARGLDVFYLRAPVVISIICLLLGFFTPDLKYAGGKSEDWGKYRELFKVKGVKLLLATAATMALADAMTLSVASLASSRAVAASFFMASASISAVLIRTVGFRLVSKIPRTLLAAPAAALMGLSLLALSFSSTSALFVLFGLTYGLGIGIGFPTDLALVGDLLSVNFRPKASALVLLVIDAGWMLTPLIYGFISPMLGENNTFRTFGIAVSAAALCLFLCCWLPLEKFLKTEAE